MFAGRPANKSVSPGSCPSQGRASGAGGGGQEEWVWAAAINLLITQLAPTAAMSISRRAGPTEGHLRYFRLIGAAPSKAAQMVILIYLAPLHPHPTPRRSSRSPRAGEPISVPLGRLDSDELELDCSPCRARPARAIGHVPRVRRLVSLSERINFSKLTSKWRPSNELAAEARQIHSEAGRLHRGLERV